VNNESCVFTGQRVEAERRHGRAETPGWHVQRDHARDSGRKGAETFERRSADIDSIRYGPSTGASPVTQARAQASGGEGMGVGAFVGGGWVEGCQGRVECRGAGRAGKPRPGGRLRGTGHT